MSDLKKVIKTPIGSADDQPSSPLESGLFPAPLLNFPQYQIGELSTDFQRNKTKPWVPIKTNQGVFEFVYVGRLLEQDDAISEFIFRQYVQHGPFITERPILPTLVLVPLPDNGEGTPSTPTSNTVSGLLESIWGDLAPFLR